MASSLSQGLVLATAMAVSAGTILLFDLCREKYFSATQIVPTPQKHHLRSCLSSGGKKKTEKTKKKKRVQFAADVKEPSGNGEEYRREQQQRRSTEFQRVSSACGMPANRMALYSGILRDRLQQRMEFSY
ncbi:OLC1v1037453C1 [Oldenlandia corymbosa var. corymbosa]|uniref:OLC1v1037453C1 n=1 Tax=Oldenlandia corymbosa var. corymbosa TaxID=529605 RepID=A0AAV1E3W0_OLDCO|nr:OLC1v1037453C1 [Oldenlandia corymbosa var. corymbosa]